MAVTRTEADSDKALTFSENLENNALLENLRNQRDAKKFCDIVLHVRGKRFEAHRSVLAASSPYFESVLKNHKVTKEEITIGWHDVKTFEILLDYMYTGTVLINEENIYELLKLSNHFLISKLKSYCEEYLERYMDLDNCLYVLELSEKYNMESLTDTALNMIRDNINTLLEKPEILEFPIKRLENFLTDPGTGCDTVPFQILMNLICSWVKKDIPKRSYEIQRLLDVINWRENSPEDILEHIKNETLYQESKLCLYLALKTLMLNEVPIGTYEDGYQELKSEFENFEFNAPVNDDGDGQIIGAVTEIDTDGGLSLVTNSPITVEPVLLTAEGTPKRRPGRKPKPKVTVEPVENLESLKRKDAISDDLITPRRKRVVKNKYAGSEWVTDDQLSNTKSATKSKDTPKKIKKITSTPVLEEELADYIAPEVAEEEETRGENAKWTMEETLEEDTEEDPIRTEYVIRGKKHSATLAQWREGVKCPHCIYVGHSATRLEQHLARVHEEDNTYKCRLCNYTCKWNREYYKHMKAHFEGPPYKCEDCEYTCDRIQFILSHRMRHTDERPFSCEICPFKSRTKGNLIVHMRIHTGEKPYKCQFCGRCFAMKNTLDQHLATHRDDRPYLCDTCGFTTKYQSHLLSHKRIHTGNVFHCQQPNCNYFSPRRSQLAAHMRSHLSIRAHICSTCGRGFIEKSHLIRHERIHLEEKPFKCEYCDYGSTRRDKLKEHMIKHHSGDGTNKTYKPRKSRRASAALNVIEDEEIQPNIIISHDAADLIQHGIQMTENEMATANLIYEYANPGDGEVIQTRVLIQPALEFTDGTQTVVVEQKGDEDGDEAQHVVIQTNYEEGEEGTSQVGQEEGAGDGGGEGGGENADQEEAPMEECGQDAQVIKEELGEGEAVVPVNKKGRPKRVKKNSRHSGDIQTFMALLSN